MMKSPLSFAERRLGARHSVRYLRCYSPVPGTILDLNEWGMCLEALAELQSGKIHRFKVRSGSMLFVFEGTVRWSRLQSSFWDSAGTSLDMHEYGVSFSELLSKETIEYLTQNQLS